MADNGRAELARRLHRIFLAALDDPSTVIPMSTLLGFADDILAGDYSDVRYGPRDGDGGPPMRFVEARPWDDG